MIALDDVGNGNVEELRFDLPLTALGITPEAVDLYREKLRAPFVNPDGATFPVVVQSWVPRREGLNLVVEPVSGE